MPYRTSITRMDVIAMGFLNKVCKYCNQQYHYHYNCCGYNGEEYDRNVYCSEECAEEANRAVLMIIC